MSLDKVWFSFIEYRPDPSEPEKDRIALGGAASARIGRGHTLLLAARVQLTESELKAMDGIGREMLARPSSYFQDEINRLLKTVSVKEGGVLSALSGLHRWSLYVAPPRMLQVEKHLSQTKSEALATVCRDLTVAHMLGRDVPLKGRLRSKKLIPDDWRAQLPPAWQLTTHSFAPSAATP